jgi:TatD DNase family protein
MINWVKELRNINHPLGTSPGIFHSFEGNLLDAQELLEYGFIFGIGGPLTYKNSSQKFDVFSTLSEEAICLETDSPYLPPSPHRGKRNEPAFLPLIGSKLAQMRIQNEDEFINRLFNNSYKMLIEDIIH